MQTPQIHICQYGIPTIGEFCKDDSNREYIKIPLDPNNKESMIFKQQLEAIDKWAEEDNKANIVGKNAKSYQYIKIVRKAFVNENDDDEEEKKPKGKYPVQEKMDYIKVKFDMVWETKDIKTKIFRKLSDEEAKEKGSKRELVEVNTVTDIANVIRFGSKVRMVVMLNKLWASNSKDSSGMYKYGITMKALQIEVEPPANRVGQNVENIAFIESDEEEATTSQEKEPAAKNTKAEPVKKIAADLDDESNEDDDEEDDSDDKKPMTNKLDSDESEESDDEVVVKPKKGATKTVSKTAAKGKGKAAVK
jgi:hypothetical protein